MIAFLVMRYNEKKGHWPLMKAKAASPDRKASESSSDGEVGIAYPAKSADPQSILTRVRSVDRSPPV